MSTWARGPSIAVGRLGASAVCLVDGRALLAGGCVEDEPDRAALASAEIWDPAQGAWTAAAPMTTPRWQHAACALDDGGALVFGGLTDTSLRQAVESVERFDPSGVWEPWGQASGTTFPCCVGVMPDASVLVVGREGEVTRWDIATRRGERVAPSPMRAGAVPVVLEDGRLMLVGGYRARRDPKPDAALWDARTDTWTSLGQLGRPRHAPTATRLSDGSVLVVGGYDYDRNRTVAHVDRWSPMSGRFETLGETTIGRCQHSATLLVDGTVLIVGGHRRAGGITGALTEVEIFDPSHDALTRTTPLTGPRRGHSAVSLTDGSVMIVGGGRESGPVREVELWPSV